MAVPGLGTLIADCAASSGSFQFRNSSATDETVFVTVGDFTKVEQIAPATTSTPSPGRFIAQTTYQVGRGIGSTGQLATIETFLTADDTSCSFQAQVVSLTR